MNSSNHSDSKTANEQECDWKREKNENMEGGGFGGQPEVTPLAL